MRHFFSFLLFLFCAALFPYVLIAQDRTDKKLERKIVAAMKDFRGVSGMYVKNLKTGRTAAFQADTVFPTASMIKIPIMVGVMSKLEQGELAYHKPLEYKDSLLYAGEDILGSFKSGEKIELGKVMMLMLTTSDNTASLWLQSLAGTGTRINELMDSLGLQYTRVNSRTPGREMYRSQYGWGQTTPREMATLVEKIYKGEVISEKASHKMIRLLGRNYWDEHALSQVPPTIFMASKNGAVNESRSETVLVMAPHGPYVFSIITKNIVDQSWQPSNEAWQLINKLSALLWQHYEPRLKYEGE